MQIEDGQLFSELFDELGEAVLISDASGLIVRSNRAAERILGVPAEELRSLTHDDPIWQAVREDGSLVPISELPATKALRTKNPVSNIEIGVLRPDGSLVWILESAAPILDEDGNVTGVIVTFPDVTLAVKQRQDLRELNEKYLLERDRANEANRLKSAFLANMSHEIRTPMTAILGFSEVLTTELSGKIEEHHAAFLRSINVSGRRLLALLNDILDLSKIEAGHVEMEKNELDVVAEIEACVTPLRWIAQQKSLELRMDLYPEPVLIRGDRHRFAQIMTNLVSNGIKFTPQGSVRLRVSLEGSSGAASNAPPHVKVEVEDTGIGISEEFLPNIFEEFRQEHSGITKEFGGTGLGLAIADRLITRMGGTIEVRSRVNEGSVFTVRFPVLDVGRLPIAPPKEMEDELIREHSTPASKNTNERAPLILVVEDNLETQRLIGAYLREGYRLSFAQDSDEVSKAIRAEIPALILMDINLPGRDGLTITRDIRSGSRCPNVPIVALTAFAMSGDREKCREAGCNDYLSKPATRREVREMAARFANAEGGAPA